MSSPVRNLILAFVPPGLNTSHTPRHAPYFGLEAKRCLLCSASSCQQVRAKREKRLASPTFARSRSLALSHFRSRLHSPSLSGSFFLSNAVLLAVLTRDLPRQHPWRLARVGRLARGKILPPLRRLQLQPGPPRTAYRMEVRAGSAAVSCARAHFHSGQRA
jgi:hypothetical protein